jgi:hypothetical protein
MHTLLLLTRIGARELFLKKRRVYFVRKCSNDFDYILSKSATFMPF